VLAQPAVGAVHIAHDNGDVLEPSVVAAGIDRRRPAPRREEFGQFDVLFTEPDPRRPHPETEYAGKALVGVERDGTIEIRDRQSDRVDSFDKRLRSGKKNSAGQQQGAEDTARHHDNLSTRRSPTRKALAMIVSAGFTAPLDGKKLPSTT